MNSRIISIFSLSILLTLYICSEYSSQSNVEKFSQWIIDQGINIKPSEFTYRLMIFQENFQKIKEHNKGQDKTYLMSLNAFAHLSEQEFRALYTKKIDSTHQIVNHQISTKKNINLGASIDWEKLGKVNPVQNMGNCNAGYAFCTTSLLESFMLIKKNQNVSLSNQQIVDCSADYQTFGCDGGTRTGAIQFSQKQGLTTTQQYPYVQKKGDCKVSQGQYKLPQKIVTANGCDQLAKQIQKSPLTIAVNTKGWQFYQSGIFTNCGTEVDHDVYLVGMDSTYWRIKNSWGVRWGQNGYIRIGPQNTCGICSRPGYGFQ